MEGISGWALSWSLFVLCSPVSGSHLPLRGLATVLAARKSGACGAALPLNRLWRTAACGLHSFTRTASETGASSCGLSPDLRAMNTVRPAVRQERAVPLPARVTALEA